jgi:biotin synthase
LKVLCMMRFVNPAADLRAAGGREVTLRSLQPLALYPCNSFFTRGYLTTGGNDETRDLQMLSDLGFEPEA